MVLFVMAVMSLFSLALMWIFCILMAIVLFVIDFQEKSNNGENIAYCAGIAIAVAFVMWPVGSFVSESYGLDSPICLITFTVPIVLLCVSMLKIAFGHFKDILK